MFQKYNLHSLERTLFLSVNEMWDKRRMMIELQTTSSHPNPEKIGQIW